MRNISPHLILETCILSEAHRCHLGHSLGSSRKSVHERPRNSDGWQVEWSVFRAIWLKRQDPQLSNDVYEGGVFIWSKSVKTRIFSEKMAEKLLFGRPQILIRWLQSRQGPPILKVSTFSKGCDENMGHNGQNEPWASLLASILSDRQPLENFYQEDTKKCKKRQFLAFRQINWDFACATYIQGTTIWKLTSWRLRKSITFM